MKYCNNCGKEIPQGAVYCPECGRSVTYVAPPQTWWNWDRYTRENDWWGLVTAFGFLVVIGLTIVAYPDVFSRITRYLESFATYGHPVLPSYNLGQVLIYLFNLSGLWGIIAAVLRFFVTGSASKAARDGAGAIFSLYTANILTQFYGGFFNGWGLVGMWIVGLVILIVADALIAFFVPRRVVLYNRIQSQTWHFTIRF
jgi:hypothetical protein